jgi:uncharacterized oxidoreductase
MPTLTAPQLVELGKTVLKAAGVPAGDAAVVAEELAEANLVGHDSHGVMRLVQYVEMIQANFVKPGSPVELVREDASTAVFDAHFNLGQVAAKKALDTALTKAKATGSATVMVRNCNHVGRLGSYAETAAKAGYLAMMAVNSPGPGGVRRHRSQAGNEPDLHGGSVGGSSRRPRHDHQRHGRRQVASRVSER